MNRLNNCVSSMQLDCWNLNLNKVEVFNAITKDVDKTSFHIATSI